MYDYNASHLNYQATLLEEFHKIQRYLIEHPLYQIYQSSADYVAGVNEYYINEVSVREGGKLSVGDIVLFSNVYYGVITEIDEETEMLTIAEGISFRGATGETGPRGGVGPRGLPGATGAKGEPGATGATGEPGKDGKNGLSIYLYDGALYNGTTSVNSQQVEIPPNVGRGLQVGDILFSTYETSLGAISVVTGINNGTATVDYIGQLAGTSGAVTGQSISITASEWVWDTTYKAFKAVITMPITFNGSDSILLSRTVIKVQSSGKGSNVFFGQSIAPSTLELYSSSADNVTFAWTIIPSNSIQSGVVIIQDEYRSKIIELSYEDLKLIKDNGHLIPGQMYGLVNYYTTTTQKNTRRAPASATSQSFDLILTATSPSSFSETAKAKSNEISATYWASSNLDAWEIKYCFDNDKTRFWWADETNGKGVIYYMKDEYGNECPYDFKNIQFKRENTYYYTFSWVDENNTVKDLSVVGNTELYNDEGQISGCFGNKIGAVSSYTSGNFVDNPNKFSTTLNNNVFISTYSYDEGFFYGCDSNTFGNYCVRNTFGNGCSGNTFGDDCYSNTFGNKIEDNTFGNNCFSNTFGNYCTTNTFGNYCDSNTLGDYCNTNTFGNYCASNIIDNGVNDAQPQPTTGAGTMQGVHIHYGVRGQFTVVRDATYTQDVRTANDVTITV